ncbi:DUF6285 domain-containing protein [Vineibacter terrae]|uniref:DUF6285 domain-containing protein n=1 Tax=Vineibacter terrae TaxID=2586908 RepID=UPI002E305C55|nr:DUF6285 domain-containing protein [Vineibacter terrae]HEX2891812.1 DUF6285 domain-containing protein [Vineibacter terrae]
MSQDRPDIDDILSSVQHFLGGHGEGQPGEQRFHAQVAAYLLGICRRELQHGAALEAAERQRLAAFLGVEDGVAALNRRLSADIRAGRLDERWSEAFELVLAHVVDKVTVVRPERLEPDHRR